MSDFAPLYPTYATEQAQKEHFIGSPTVIVNGLDIDPSARDIKTFAVGGRRYGASVMPPREMIEKAFREATQDKGGNNEPSIYLLLLGAHSGGHRGRHQGPREVIDYGKNHERKKS